MNIYLIDYENVNEQGLRGVDSLADGDMVNIFYSKNIKTIPFERSLELARSKAAVESVLIRKTGKNYLDFQLTTLLGYLICKFDGAAFFIISKDTGFDSTVDFWKERNVEISRKTSIADDGKEEKEEQKKAPEKKAPEKKTSERKVPERKTPEKKAPEKKALEKKTPEKKTAEQKKTSEKKQAKETNVTKVTGKTASDVKTEAKAAEQVTPVITAAGAVVSHGINEEKNTAPENENKVTEKKKSIPKPALPESYRKKVREALASEKLPPNAYTGIYRAIVESRDKVLLNNALVRQFDNVRGGVIYNKIKLIYMEFQEENAKKVD